MNQVHVRMREELQAFKRDRILAEAVRLFYENGFTGTTLDDVAHALGVTKPFIYTHFRGKAEILAAVCLPPIQMSCEAVERAVAGEGSARDKLYRAMVDFMQVVLDRQPNMAVYFREEKHLDPETLATVDTFRKTFDARLSDLLSEGCANGQFEVPDVRVAALALGGMISWAYTWHRPGGRLSPQALSARMADLALRMVGAEPMEAVQSVRRDAAD
jgi:AcrR family transcriptional regulator